MKKRWIFAAAAMAMLLSGCGAMEKNGMESPMPGDAEISDSAGGMNPPNFVYEGVSERGFVRTEEEASSYFSLDRNTAGYSQVRAQILSGKQVSPDSVRAEEMINYFSYDFPAPEEGELVKASAYLFDCPWNSEHLLMGVGVRTEERAVSGGRNNYVLLIDVSGSMSAWAQGLDGMTVFDLVKLGARKLVENLGENDTLSIVTYASGVEVKLEPTYADEEGKAIIDGAVSSLNAYGSTNGSGGLQLAYEQAEKHFSEEGNNRVILMTDGDFNVGYRNADELKEFIQDKAKSGVYLSVLGFGMGNMRDDLMQTLALNGNGNYAYIDSPAEAEKVLCEELGGMLVPVAKDAKAKVTFSPENVSSYRLIGYDQKRISAEDYENSQKDAGDLGSNLTAVALYEIEPKGEPGEGLVAEVCVRFKTVSGEEREAAVTVFEEKTESEDTSFLACVAEFALVLRKSAYRGEADLSALLNRLERLDEYLKADPYKTEFLTLVRLAKERGLSAD